MSTLSQILAKKIKNKNHEGPLKQETACIDYVDYIN